MGLLTEYQAIPERPRAVLDEIYDWLAGTSHDLSERGGVFVGVADDESVSHGGLQTVWR